MRHWEMWKGRVVVWVLKKCLGSVEESCSGLAEVGRVGRT